MPVIAGRKRIVHNGGVLMRRGMLITIINACVWGFVLVASAIALKGTDSFEKIQLILGGGAAFSLMLVGNGMKRKPKKKSDKSR